MWNMTLPWWEFVVRGAIVYFFLLVLLRVTGKRNTGQLAPFDLVLLLVLSNAVQNSMNGGDNSIPGGLICATTLVGLHYGVAYLTFRSKTLEKWIEGTPRVLIRNGVLNDGIMREELLTHNELGTALRAAGCGEVGSVHLATLENNGQITVVMNEAATRPTSVAAPKAT